jgi:hypothetical protein
LRQWAIKALDDAVDVQGMTEIRDEGQQAFRAWSRSLLFAVLAILVALGGVVYVAIQMAAAIAEATS